MQTVIGAAALRAGARFLLLLALTLAAAASFCVPEAAAQKRIYISVDDHTDYMWRADEAGYQDAFLQMLDYYLNAADTTAANPPELQSRFNTDGTFWLWTYERNKPAADFDRLISRVADGHIGVPLNALVSTYGAQPAEAVLRGMYYAGRLERRYGLRFPLVEAMENQTLPYGVGMLWSGAGPRYSWRGVCGCVSHVFSLSRREHEIYHWAGADGTTLLMKWNSMLETNSSIGGYAEARDPVHAITFLDSDPTFQSLYPYGIIGAFGKGWDDVMTTDLATVIAAHDNTTPQRQVIVSNEVDFFQDFEQTYGATLPQVALGFGNEWDVYSASMPELSASVRRAVEKLRSAEALASLVSVQNPAFLDGRTAARDDAFMALGLYWEHDWTADGWIARTDRALWQRKIAGQVTSYVDALQNDAAVALGGMIANGSGNPRFYVFNALSWARDDIADFAYAGVGPVHVIDVSTAAEVPSQLVTVDGQQRLRILAGNVPAVGYKVYEIQAGAGAAFVPAATTGVSTIENATYRIALGANGAVSSLIDKAHNNREVVRMVNGRTLNDLGLGNATFTVENAGPVSVTLKAVVDAPIAHETRITLSALDRIDVRNDISQGFSGVFTWAYGFGINAPVTRHEEVGAIVRAAKASAGGIYSERNARYDWLTLNHFADMSESTDDFGVTLSSADLIFMQLGQSQNLFLDTLTPQISVLAGGQIDGPGWGIPDQGGDTHFLQRFALRTHGQYDAAAAMRFSLEHQNPLVTAAVTGGSAYPASTYSFMTVSDPNVLLWSLKPAEDGIAQGLVARFWNLGTNGGFTATTPLPIATAERTTHIETPLTAAQLSAGSLVAIANPQQMVTYRFVLGQAAPPPPPPPSTDPAPAPAPAALPTLSVADVTVTEPD